MADGSRPLHAARAPARVEVRVFACDGRWQVHPHEGRDHRFLSKDAALGRAHELARRAFADDDRLSCVKCLVDDTWDVVAVFGVSPPAARMSWVPVRR